MASTLLQVGELASKMQEKPVTLLRALMDDPLIQTPDMRGAMVLPASVDLDLDGEGSDHATGFPHSMPSAENLALYLGNQGITANTTVVAYDTRGIYSAPRAWWMLKAIGHNDVYLLDGGQPAWQDAGLPVSERAGIKLSLPIICTCGSGITACVVGFAAILCGAKEVSIYDGSWSEWGADPQYPVVVD